MIWCWSNWSWIYWYYFCVRFIESGEISAGLLTVSKNPVDTGVCLGIYEMIWFKFDMIIDSIKGFWPEWCISTAHQCRDVPFWSEIHGIELYILILVKVTLTFIQGHRTVKKEKLVHQLSNKSPFGMGLVCVFKLVILVNLISMRSHLINSQGREPFCYLVQNNPTKHTHKHTHTLIHTHT